MRSRIFTTAMTTRPLTLLRHEQDTAQAGTLTDLWRPVEPQPPRHITAATHNNAKDIWWWWDDKSPGLQGEFRCPFGAVGDVLVVISSPNPGEYFHFRLTAIECIPITSMTEAQAKGWGIKEKMYVIDGAYYVWQQYFPAHPWADTTWAWHGVVRDECK